MLELRNEKMYLLTWNRAYIYNKIYHKETFTKTLFINIKEKQFSVNEVCFYVNLTPSILYTKNIIYTQAVHIPPKKFIWLSFQVPPSTNRASQFLFIKVTLFLQRIFFCFVSVFLVLDCFFLDLLQFSFERWTTNDFKFLTSIRKIN